MIQHVTQNNNGIANDCAPACFVMAVNAHRGTEYTIPQVDQDIQNVPNGVTSVARLINAFRSYKVPALDAEYRDPHWCKSMLNAGHILIPSPSAVPRVTSATTTCYCMGVSSSASSVYGTQCRTPARSRGHSMRSCHGW
ncbi:MAG: hypothetical protein IPK52_00245 [Chloroflexi bacterium]|nr:hypothetical protein [Chloroflexota bacterium]